MTEGFEDLEQRFEDIEAYITCFPDDQNIVKTSTKMIASILKAVEDVVGYYISNRGELPPNSFSQSNSSVLISKLFTAKKALSIVFNGDEYRETLTSSLASITLASNALLHQAQNSSMWQNRESEQYFCFDFSSIFGILLTVAHSKAPREYHGLSASKPGKAQPISSTRRRVCSSSTASTY